MARRIYHVIGGELVRKGRTVVTPPPPPPPPIDTGRPTGPQYVRYEDIYVSGDSLQQTFNRVTPDANGSARIVTLPEGVFTFSDFTNGYYEGFRLGNGGAVNCRGIVGSGRNTILKPVANTASRDKGGSIAGTQFTINSRNNAVIGNFTMKGTPQNGLSYGGFTLDKCHDSQVFNMYLQGASPGYGNSPPGETFGMNAYLSNRVEIRDCEIDGRDDNGNRVCASPIGWNTASDARLLRTYVHHGLTGMLTFWQTTNIYTEDFRSFSTGSSTGKLAGAGINHEESNGVIRHIRPELTLFGQYSTAPGHTSNNGNHITLQNTTAQMLDVQIIEPVFDRGPGSTGMFSVAMYSGYSDGGRLQVATVPPKVVKSGVTMLASNHPQPGWGDKDPALYFSVIH